MAAAVVVGKQASKRASSGGTTQQHAWALRWLLHTAAADKVHPSFQQYCIALPHPPHPAPHAPEATSAASGLQATTSTHVVCPLHVCCGVCVAKSQKRTLLSPLPEARRRPSGEKLTDSTASAWPGSVAVQRATARTRKTACGWYTTRSTDSTDTCDRCEGCV